MTRVIEYRHIEDLIELRSVWRLLLEQTPGASFFHSLEWLELYWRYFGQEQQLRVLVTVENSQVTGILPLVIRRETTRAGSMRVLTYPLHDWGSFYSAVGPSPADTLVACFQYLREQVRDWDLLDLRWVDKSQVHHANTSQALNAAGFPNREQVWRPVAVVDIPETWERYLASRSSKFRNNLRRASAASSLAGELTFERYRPVAAADGQVEPRWDNFDECQALARRSWQASSEDGTTISHPQVGDFFRELFGVATCAGALDMNLLRHNGRLIAFSFNLVMHGQVSGLRMGFDSAASALSPGRLLLAHSIEDSCHRGDRILDWGSESMAFKRQWLTRTLNIYRYTHYPRFSLRGQLLRTKHWLFPAVKFSTLGKANGGSEVKCERVR
jgi:CelD/BcsL family acetyltransferase involved in cellulose biosynthesis